MSYTVRNKKQYVNCGYDVLDNQEKNTCFSFQLHLHHIKNGTFFWRKSGIFWKIKAPSETVQHSRPFSLSLQISWSKGNITSKTIFVLWEGRIEGQVFWSRALWTRSSEFIYMYSIEVYVVGLCFCFRRFDSVHLPGQSAVKSEKMNVDELFWNISSV